MTPTTRTRFCGRCGQPGPFRDDRAERCVACDEVRLEERRKSGRPYHRARYRSWKRLEAAHQEEFEGYMKDELPKARRAFKKEMGVAK